jgi:Sigma-70 region 2
MSPYRYSTLVLYRGWNSQSGFRHYLACSARHIPFACHRFVACWTVARAAFTPVFPNPGTFSVADPYTFLSVVLMVFVLDAGLFSVDTHISKKVRDSPVTMERHSSIRTEAEMIAAILAGDTQLYHELVHPHERCVFLMALSFMKNKADAEDVAQEAFLKAFRNLSTFKRNPCSAPGSSALHSMRREADFGDRRSFGWNRLTILPMTGELCLRLCYGTGAKFLWKLWNGGRFVRCFRKQFSASPRFIARSFNSAMSRTPTSRKPQKRSALVSRLLKCDFTGRT